MRKIVIAGSINMDIVLQMKRHPNPGETLVGKSLHFIPGGKGSNQAVAVRRLGGEVLFIAKVGQDVFGDKLMTFLKDEGIDLKLIGISPTLSTGTAVIMVDQNSENEIVVIPGSNSALTIEDVSKIDFNASEIVVAQFEIPQAVIYELFKKAHVAGATTILNPAPAMTCKPELWAISDYVILNETELASFAQNTKVSENITTVLSEAGKVRASEKQTMIVTLGAKGAVAISSKNNVLEVKGHKVNAVDTTGAGDCFVGAFAYALCISKALESALYFANAAAAVSVQSVGASASLPNLEEVEALIKKHV